MANYFLMVRSKESAYFKYYCSAISDAVFIMLPGERERVTAHLRKLGMTDEQIKRVPRKYWRRRCRYTVPAPQVLVERITAVYQFFMPLIDPVASKPFFNSDHARRFAVEINYVKKGSLSDPPERAMYIPMKTLHTGLVIYMCLRTSSAIKGYHLHVRQVCKVNTYSKFEQRVIRASSTDQALLKLCHLKLSY
jgi:hypothetical protein